MGKVILDAELNAKLHGLNEQMEVCAPDGRTMGRFIPEDTYQKFLYQLAEASRPVLSPAEIQRRKELQGHKSLTEIMQDLGAS
jgi:hypothetical protein